MPIFWGCATVGSKIATPKAACSAARSSMPPAERLLRIAGGVPSCPRALACPRPRAARQWGRCAHMRLFQKVGLNTGPQPLETNSRGRLPAPRSPPSQPASAERERDECRSPRSSSRICNGRQPGYGDGDLNRQFRVTRRDTES